MDIDRCSLKHRVNRHGSLNPWAPTWCLVTKRSRRERCNAFATPKDSFCLRFYCILFAFCGCLLRLDLSCGVSFAGHDYGPQGMTRSIHFWVADKKLQQGFRMASKQRTRENWAPGSTHDAVLWEIWVGPLRRPTATLLMRECSSWNLTKKNAPAGNLVLAASECVHWSLFFL